VTLQDLQPADYVLGAFVAFLGILGIFRGFSGAFALLVASAASFAFAMWLWPLGAGWTGNLWLRGFAVSCATLVLFGTIRVVVKKAVHGLLDQPLDAIAGCITGLVCGCLVVLAVSAVPESRSWSLVARGLGYYVW